MAFTSSRSTHGWPQSLKGFRVNEFQYASRISKPRQPTGGKLWRSGSDIRWCAQSVLLHPTARCRFEHCAQWRLTSNAPGEICPWSLLLRYAQRFMPQLNGSAPLDPTERRIVLLVAAIQLINVLDFVIVMPLGPDFSQGLGIPTSNIGLISGSYTFAAAIAGAAGSLWLDRVSRRKALLWSLVGLVLSTFAASLVTNLATLLGARLLAGIFGGPATALGIALVTDAVPVNKRGRALGTVMAAFSVASVLGIPLGLEISRLCGWRATFLCVAGLGAMVTTTFAWLMPASAPVFHKQPAPFSASQSSASSQPNPSQRQAFRAPQRLLTGPALVALSYTFLMSAGVFAIVPSLAAYIQFNLGYPRESLGMLYMVGGIFSFATLRIAGLAVDHLGVKGVLVTGTVVHSLALGLGFLTSDWAAPAMLLISAYMISGGLRMVPIQTIATRVPLPHQRAQFLSAQSALRHAGSAVGAFLSSAVLVATPDGRLENMPLVALCALTAAWLIVPLVFWVETAVRKRERESFRQ